MDRPGSSQRNSKPGKYKLPRPQGLRGRLIGLFYRDIARAKSAKEAAVVADSYAKIASQQSFNDVSGLTKKQRRAQHIEKRNRIIGPVSIYL